MSFWSSIYTSIGGSQRKKVFLGKNESYLKNISPEDNKFYDKIYHVNKYNISINLKGLFSAWVENHELIIPPTF